MTVRVTVTLAVLHGINVVKNPRMSAKVKVAENELGYEFYKGGAEK